MYYSRSELSIKVISTTYYWHIPFLIFDYAYAIKMEKQRKIPHRHKNSKIKLENRRN
jgi:hypothetical protein